MDSGEFLAMLKGCIGSKVSLVIDAGLYKGTYPSRIEDVDEESIGLAHPMMRGALLPVHRSVQLKMSVEAGGALFFSLVSISKGLVRENLPLLWVTPVGEARKIQRRLFVRVPCLLKTGLFRLEGEDYRPEKEEWTYVNAKDISLGGIGFSVPREKAPLFPERARFLVDLVLQGKKYLLVGKIVKIIPKSESLELGVAFEGMPVFAEKPLGSFIRQQELAGRQS